MLPSNKSLDSTQYRLLYIACYHNVSKESIVTSLIHCTFLWTLTNYLLSLPISRCSDYLQPCIYFIAIYSVSPQVTEWNQFVQKLWCSYKSSLQIHWHLLHLSGKFASFYHVMTKWGLFVIFLLKGTLYHCMLRWSSVAELLNYNQFCMFCMHHNHFNSLDSLGHILWYSKTHLLSHKPVLNVRNLSFVWINLLKCLY